MNSEDYAYLDRDADGMYDRVSADIWEVLKIIGAEKREGYTVTAGWAKQLAKTLAIPENDILQACEQIGYTVYAYRMQDILADYFQKAAAPDAEAVKAQLRPLFQTLKTVPDDLKKTETFAKNAIHLIQAEVPDFDAALALYNQEAGFVSGHYEPQGPFVRCICGKCQTTAYFDTLAQVKEAKCMVCNASFGETDTSLEIDEAGTGMKNGRLIIRLKNISSHIQSITYRVSTQKAAMHPKLSPEKRMKEGILVKSMQEYKRDQMIVIDYPPKGMLYVTAMGEGELSNGQKCFTDAVTVCVRNLDKIKISCFMKWEMTGLFVSKPVPRGCDLMILTPEKTLPPLRLVCRRDGYMPMQADDPENMTLMQLPQDPEKGADGMYCVSIPDEIWEHVPKGARMRLMTDSKDEEMYEILDDPVTMTVPFVFGGK